MTGNAFVISDGFVQHQRALGWVSDSYDDTTRALPIRRARYVVRGLGLREAGDRLDGYRRLRQEPEQLRQLRLHLVDVFLKIIDDLLFALRLPLRVVVDRLAETGEILLTLRQREFRHLRRDAFDFL